ncbi:MAG: CRTAC1 family protein [Bacteroidota bacterium]
MKNLWRVEYGLFDRYLIPLYLLCLFPCTLIGQTPFTEITAQAGIDHQFIVYEGMFGGGICVFDLNMDGFEDLFLTSGMNEDVLYLNQGDGTFKNIYEGSGLEETRKYVTQGVSGADVNRDGWVDLFITTITTKDSTQKIPRSPNLLFLNQGNNTFLDVSQQFGLADLPSFSTGANFGDINADGYPDLYVGNYFRNYEGDLTYINDQTIVNANQISQDFLFLNKKGKSFQDVFESYGLDYKGYSFGGIFTDFDNDGDLDLFVNHDFGYKATPNFLLENLYPQKKFKDISEEMELDLKINSMGTAVGDFDNNGFLDYYLTNIRFNAFMEHQGPGKPFVDRIVDYGMDFFTISWGSNFADFDHDGDLDLFVANGDLNPNDHPMGDFYFENTERGFVERANEMGLKDYGIGRGSVVFDMENDGDLDILVINQKAVMEYGPSTVTRLYRNDSTKGNWLKVDLTGTQSEMNGLGSRIEVVVGKRKMIREIDGGGSSHLSQNSTIAHFGVGEVDMVDSVIVKWIGRDSQVLTDQLVNQRIEFVEPEGHSQNMSIDKLWPFLGGIGMVWVVYFLFIRRKTIRE